MPSFFTSSSPLTGTKQQKLVSGYISHVSSLELQTDSLNGSFFQSLKAMIAHAQAIEASMGSMVFAIWN
jgi:hypothetical protein